MTAQAPLTRIEVAAYKIPTDAPEADGTIAWDSTTMVAVHVYAGGKVGFGYSYASAVAGKLIEEKLAPRLRGHDAFAVPSAYSVMVHAVRNVGRPGIASMAISAVDVALWDLKAKLLGLPLVTLFGAAREAAPVYGSGGFTSYTIGRLQEQLSGWVAQGIPRVKMKIGANPGGDLDRVRAARKAIGDKAELFVDANGAYDRKQALAFANLFADLGVTWFEEPVSADDREGLRLIRDRGPAGMDVAAGEYGFDAWYFRHMLEAGAVDVLQADATRCGGYTGFFQAAALCIANCMPLSAHCAPALHAPACCSALPLRNIEYFHDHVRIEHMLLDGALTPVKGALRPDLSRPGHGLELKRADAARYAA